MSRFDYLVSPDDMAELQAAMQKRREGRKPQQKEGDTDVSKDENFFKNKDKIGNYMAANACEGMNLIENIKGVQPGK